MSVVPLLSSRLSSYGTTSFVDEKICIITPKTKNDSGRDLAVCIGKFILVATVIAALVAASIFSGGAVAMGIGAGIGFLHCFGLVSLSFATGATAGMLFLGSAFKIVNKIRGICEEETDRKVSRFFRDSVFGIMCASMILSVVGAPVLVIGYSLFKSFTGSSELVHEEDSSSNLCKAQAAISNPSSLISQDRKNTVSSALSAEVSADKRHLDTLLSCTLFDDRARLRDEFLSCSENFRNVVYAKLWDCSSSSRDPSDPIWSENHLYDDMDKLRYAIRQAYLIEPAVLNK